MRHLPVSSQCCDQPQVPAAPYLRAASAPPLAPPSLSPQPLRNETPGIVPGLLVRNETKHQACHCLGQRQHHLLPAAAPWKPSRYARHHILGSLRAAQIVGFQADLLHQTRRLRTSALLGSPDCTNAEPLPEQPRVSQSPAELCDALNLAGPLTPGLLNTNTDNWVLQILL